MRLPRAAVLLAALAACASPGARALSDPGLRAQLADRMVATLDAQEHYFASEAEREDFARELRRVAETTTDAPTYYRSVAAALSRLDEGHTGLVASAEVPFAETIPPVAIVEAEEQPVVAGVAPGVESGGLLPGDVVLEVDGLPAATALGRQLLETPGSTPHGRRARAMANLLAGPTAVPAKVRVRGLDGRERVCFPLRFLLEDGGENRFRFGFAPAGVGAVRLSLSAVYVSLPDFHPDRVAELESAIETFSGTPLLVLDLRGNPGGRIQTLQRVAGLFLDGPRGLLRLDENGSGRTLEAIPGPVRFRGILRVLVDARTGSAAELLAAALQDLGRARVLGAPSAGSTRSRKSALLPGNVVFHYAATAEFRRLDGRPVEGVGVTPDVVASPARESLRGGTYGDPKRDPVVQLALRVD